MLQYQKNPSRKDDLDLPGTETIWKSIHNAILAHCSSFALKWQKSTEEAEKLEDTTKEKVKE